MTRQRTGQHGGIRSSAIPATPDDGISHGHWIKKKKKPEHYTPAQCSTVVRRI